MTRLLILGGTEFVGRAMAEAAVGRGWDVTVFHRGRYEPPAGTVSLLGDRTGRDGPPVPATGSWDAVVDTWSAAPSVVREAARELAGRVGRYVYVSSRSVYAWPAAAGLTEDGPLVAGSPDAGDGVPYGEAKRGGELAAVGAFGADRALLVRAGLILGPYENIGRLPWWLNRIARGGPVLAPGPRELPIQFIDVRDLAEWTLDAIAAERSGPYDLVCPPGHATMGELLDACVRATGADGTAADARLCWTPPEAVLAAGVAPWTELPVWMPPGESHDAMHTSDVSKAVAAGLRCRPVAETVADTWAWLTEIGGTAPHRPDRPAVGLSAERETAVLATAPAAVPVTNPGGR
ncbi:NAD-dependent epimerase/dehydratase family protein [Streptomyces solicathayae]|uniref:NAD-dependent epimerase/dehydratase family protein n=1 Tax=Streptomyces solicathayae TaxID=3081768 RepID=A0ABZ0LZZ2_9ACTN|nr:NAD-dependent epimerase/dehydratase family protein [Streptomyces sp. HUAS YS2]WOX24756.1 NAD-dependent epimerase/dehydratase family protein [Streptomyces sp. HUAS YS2]